MVRALRPVNASLDWKLSTVLEMEAEEPYIVSTPVCVKRERNGQASADQGFSTASQGSCHVHGSSRWTHPPPPIPPFLLAQNLSSKRIAPTDNMRPKLHDEYTRYQWLKG